MYKTNSGFLDEGGFPVFPVSPLWLCLHNAFAYSEISFGLHAIYSSVYSENRTNGFLDKGETNECQRA